MAVAAVRYSIPLSFIVAVGLTHAAVDGVDTLVAPKYDVVDPYSVNMATGQVQISLTPVSIGGSMGLAHSISSLTSDFVNWPAHGGGSYTVKGFGDAHRGGMYAVLLYDRNERSTRPPGQWDMANWQYGLRVFGSAYNEEFFLDPNGVFVPFRQASSSTLVFHDDASFTGYIYTTSDGAQLYYPGSEIALIGLNTWLWRSIEKIVYPTGLVHEISINPGVDGPIYSVRTNTGFQLKYDYATSWTSESPSKVTALNNRYERCPTDSTACTPSSTWPTATYTWPLGRPVDNYPISLRRDSIFAVTDAAGRVTEYHHRDYAPPAGYIPFGDVYAPRLVKIVTNGRTAAEYDYTWGHSNLTYRSTPTSTAILVQGAPTVSSASSPGGASQSYNMHQPKVYPYTSIRMGTINSGGSGPGFVHFVDSSNSAGLDRVVSWDQDIDLLAFVVLNTQTNQYRTMNKVIAVRKTVGNSLHAYGYDDRDNVVRHTKNGVVVGEAQYPSSCTSNNFKFCNKPVWAKDANGNRTDFTYHAPSGQIASRTRPANNAGIRSRTNYVYAQYYAHYKKRSDTIEAADTPIWLLASETSCQNSSMNANGSCSGNDAVTSSYQYDYYNLYLRGLAVTAKNALGVVETHRTCYEYDKFGNRIGETSPRANLATCL